MISYFSDRVAVMHQGELVEEGPTLEVTERPQHPHTQQLLSAVLQPDPEARSAAPETTTTSASW